MKKIIIVAALMLSGCAGGYGKFYSQIATPDQMQQLALLEDGKQPTIVPVSDMRSAIHNARQKGLIPFAESNFNGPMESQSKLMAQAKKVRATVVLAASSYAETRTVNSSYTVPTTTTTFHNGTVNNGFGSASYNGTSTTYGTQTVPFTMNVDRYTQNAVYFAMPKTAPKFGVWVLDLTPEMKRKIESNFGVVVDVVREGSLAYNANILEGDIILEVNGIRIENQMSSGPILHDAKPIDGKYIFRVFRNDQMRTIDVPAN